MKTNFFEKLLRTAQLSRNEMRTIMGSYGGGSSDTCTLNCVTGPKTLACDDDCVDVLGDGKKCVGPPSTTMYC